MQARGGRPLSFQRCCGPLGRGRMSTSSESLPPSSGSGNRLAIIHTSCAVVVAPTLDRAFARWCFAVECDRPRRWAARTYPAGGTGSRCGSDERAVMRCSVRAEGRGFYLADWAMSSRWRPWVPCSREVPVMARTTQRDVMRISIVASAVTTTQSSRRTPQPNGAGTRSEPRTSVAWNLRSTPSGSTRTGSRRGGSDDRRLLPRATVVARDPAALGVVPSRPPHPGCNTQQHDTDRRDRHEGNDSGDCERPLQA